MLIGTLSGGAMLGAALPALALLGTVAVSWTLMPAESVPEAPRLAAPGVGPDVPADRSFGRSLLGSKTGVVVLVIGALGLLILILTLTTANVAGQYSLLLGGTPRGGTPPNKFEYLIRQVGFGVFPWSALMVFALGRALVRLGEGQEGIDGTRGERAGRLAYGQLYLLVFAAFGFALSTVFVLMTGDARFAPLAPLALALGAFLDEALEGERAEPVLGLLAGTGTMVVARDLFLAPEEIPSLHVLTKVKWPPQLRVAPAFLLVGFVVALGIYLGLATRGRALGKVALRDIGRAGPLRQRLERWVVYLGRWGIEAAVVAAIVFAGFVAFGVQPVLSRHFSFKPVLESYSRYAKGDEALAKYRVEGHGTGFYSSRAMEDLPTQDKVIEFLRQPKRAFALVGCRRAGGAGRGAEGRPAVVFRRGRHVVPVPAAVEPPGERRAGSEPAGEERLDGAAAAEPGPQRRTLGPALGKCPLRLARSAAALAGAAGPGLRRVRQLDRARGCGLSPKHAPPGQDSAGAPLPGQPEAAPGIQDLRALRRCGQPAVARGSRAARRCFSHLALAAGGVH